MRQRDGCEGENTTVKLFLGVQQGPVMLTAKNLQCMRALLVFAHSQGSILGSSWLLVLTTIQVLFKLYESCIRYIM